MKRVRAAGLLLLAICLVAANMRATITGVGPLLKEIGDDTGAAAWQLGLLASVPLVSWALVSPLAYRLSTIAGTSRVVLSALVVLAAGTVWRSLAGDEVGLWAGTVLIGVSLAVANVLMPAVIKRDVPGHTARPMALYTAVLGGFGAIASGVVVPLSHVQGPDGPIGWRGALLLTGVLIPPAIVVWAWVMRGSDERSSSGRRAPGNGVWRDGVAWLVAGYMGTQSAAFYILVTWLAPIATSVERTPIEAGIDVMVFQIVGIAGSLIVPALRRGALRGPGPALVPALAIVGVAGLLVAPDWVQLWAVVSGFAAGAAIGMALTLIAERSADHRIAVALSGMAQSVGYAVAAVGPVLFGWLHSVTDGWTAPLWLLIAFLVVQAMIGLSFRRDRLVLARASARVVSGE